MNDAEYKNYKEAVAKLNSYIEPSIIPATPMTADQLAEFRTRWEKLREGPVVLDDDHEYDSRLADAIAAFLHSYHSEPLRSIECAVKELEEVFQPERYL